MSLFSVQSSSFLKKFNISDLEEFGCRTSDKVESSTNLYTSRRQVINENEE